MLESRLFDSISKLQHLFVNKNFHGGKKLSQEKFYKYKAFCD